MQPQALLAPCSLASSPSTAPPVPCRADLKKAMRAIFGQFGPIMDVVSRRTYRLRGQAWVVFEKAEDAKRALEIMQGFPFKDKPMVGAAPQRHAFLLSLPSPVGRGIVGWTGGAPVNMRPWRAVNRLLPWVLCIPAGADEFVASVRQAGCCPCAEREHLGFARLSLLQRIALAKTKSDAVAKVDGTFKERPKAARPAKEKPAAGGAAGWAWALSSAGTLQIGLGVAGDAAGRQAGAAGRGLSWRPSSAQVLHIIP